MNEEPTTAPVDEDVTGHGMPIQVGTMIGGTLERSTSANRTSRGHRRTSSKDRGRESRTPQFPADSDR